MLQSIEEWGIEQGIEQGKKNMIANMLRRGISDLQFIANCAGWTVQEVKKIQQELLTDELNSEVTKGRN